MPDERDSITPALSNLRRAFTITERVMPQELGRCKHQSLDKKISELDTSKLTANVYTDHSNYSYRMDGNNVDIDTENVELASEQIKYEALTSSISSQFSRMKSVL